MNSPVRTHSFLLHGIHLAITCDPATADALASRLYYFATETYVSPDVTFEFYFVPDIAQHRIERPHEPTRPVYDPPLGEIVYAASETQLYMNYDDRVRVLCDLVRGRAQVSALESEHSNLWLLTHPLFTLALTELLKGRALYALHAAALAHDGKGVLLAGTSGAGKSTLTLALLRAGLDFLSDDLAFLKFGGEGVQVLAFPEEIDVTAETVRMFPELDAVLAEQVGRGWRKRQVSAEQAYNANVVLECQPTVLVFPRVADTDKSVLMPLTAGEAFLELVPNVMLTEPRSSQAHLDALAALAKQCACYRLETGRDLETVPTLLRERLL